MGLFDKFKKREEKVIPENQFSEENQQKAIEVLKNILHALHEKRFGDVISYVDESEIEDLETYLTESVQETIEMNDFFTIDEYGAPCLFNPAYEYSQLDMDEYNDKSGFYLEYAMTSDGDLVDITLQFKFLYTESGLKSVFCGVDFG